MLETMMPEAVAAKGVSNVIRLDPSDNVAVAAELVSAGHYVGNGVSALEDIPSGHKVALMPIKAGEPVLKFGQVIGEAAIDIAAGAWVHTPNLVFRAGLQRISAAQAAPSVQRPSRTSFKGFRRASGKAGTRNYIGVIASVNCSATVCRAIAERAERELLPRFPNIDGFVPIVHGQGCGSSAGGEGLAILRRTLVGYARHPNFAAVLLIGLGCEVNQIALYGASGQNAAIESFNIQDVGGTRAAIDLAVKRLEAIAEIANQAEREDIPVSELVIGLQCGGSDGFSGITANPAPRHRDGHAGRRRRYGGAVGDAGNLRRGTPADLARDAGRRGKADDPHPLVGKLRRRQQRLARQ